MAFNIIPSQAVVVLAIAGVGALPFGLRWLVDGVRARMSDWRRHDQRDLAR